MSLRATFWELGSVWVIITLISLAVMAGVGVSIAPNHKVSIAIIGLSMVPLLLATVERSLLFAGFAVVFSQIFEAFEINTAVGSISVGAIVMVVILLMHRTRIQQIIQQSAYLQTLLVISIAFAGVHVLQLFHQEPSIVLRQFVTLTSFVGFWVIGVSLGGTKDGRKGIALGACAALITLGVLALGVAIDIVPPPARISPPRDILGFVSPFERNYGLDVGFNSTALLLPLALPWLAQRMFRGRLDVRFVSALVYTALIAMTMLVFQSRSMILELTLGLVVVAFLTYRSVVLRGVLVLSVVFAGAQLTPGFRSTDQISSDIRSDSYSYVSRYINEHRSTLLVGTDVTEIRKNIEAESRYGELVGAAPVHNVFLAEILAAGLLTTIFLAALFIVPIWRAIQRSDLATGTGALVLAAVAITLTEVSINPAEANVAGLWLTLGAIAAMAANPRQFELMERKPSYINGQTMPLFQTRPPAL